MDEWIPRFGAPKALHSDQGTNFESAVFRGVCELLGVDKTRTTPFRPQSDGQVERFNSTLQQMLAKTSARCHWDWDLMLPFALMAYRATPHQSTGLTPNMMLFGREITEPIDLVVGLPPDSPAVSAPQYVRDLREKLEEAHAMAREALGRSTRRAKSFYDRKAHEKQYRVGDLVWRYTKGRKRVRGKVPKFLPHYDGPYVVRNVLDPFAYLIQRGDRGTLRVVHHDDLKPYHSRAQLELQWEPSTTGEVKLPDIGDPPSESHEMTSDGSDIEPPSSQGAPDKVKGDLDSDSPVSTPDTELLPSPRNAGTSRQKSEPKVESGGGGKPSDSNTSPQQGTRGVTRPQRPTKAPSRYGDWVRVAAGSANGEGYVVNSGISCLPSLSRTKEVLSASPTRAQWVVHPIQHI